MANGTTRWRPDTCGCVVLYDWNNDNGASVITNPRFEVVCRAHLVAKDDNARFQAVKTDNAKARAG